MRNIKLVIEYDGKNFAGWQTQPGKVSIQSEIERAIKDKQTASDKVAQYHKDNAEKHREYNREWARKNYQRKKVKGV